MRQVEVCFISQYLVERAVFDYGGLEIIRKWRKMYKKDKMRYI